MTNMPIFFHDSILLGKTVHNAIILNVRAIFHHDTKTFIQSFRPLVPLLKETADELTPERAFHIQLLLIHFYRRVVLKDPLLPEELLPAHWAGHTARQLCINIYQRVAPAALVFVSEKGETSVGCH